MTDKQFSYMMAVLYLLPLPVIWLVFPPTSTLGGVMYIVVTIWGLWEAYKNYKDARRAKDEERTRN